MGHIFESGVGSLRELMRDLAPGTRINGSDTPQQVRVVIDGINACDVEQVFDAVSARVDFHARGFMHKKSLEISVPVQAYLQAFAPLKARI